MNEFERRQNARRELYEERAEKARRRAESCDQSADAVLSVIPPGQPILVGHHSEKRHRRDLARADGAMRRAHEEREKADHYRRKADSTGRGGISSDDPDAIAKLEAKLTALETSQLEMKRRNADHRKNGGPPDARPHEAWELSNNNGNIRRYKERIQELLAKASRAPQADINGAGWTISEARHENRILVSFEERPSRETGQMLRSFGWKRRRDDVTYSRHLNASGWCSAALIARKLAGDTQPEPDPTP